MLSLIQFLKVNSKTLYFILILLLATSCRTSKEYSLIRGRTTTRTERLRYIEIDSLEQNGCRGVLVVIATQNQSYYIDEWMGLLKGLALQYQNQVVNTIQGCAEQSKLTKNSKFEICTTHLLWPNNNEAYSAVSGATFYSSKSKHQLISKENPFIAGILKTNLAVDVVYTRVKRIDLDGTLIIKNEFAYYTPHRGTGP